MNFSINLATRVYVDFRRVSLFFAAVGLILSCWLVVSIYTCVGNSAQMAKVTEYKARLTRGTETKKISESEYAAFLAKVNGVNSILYKRSYDWLALLAHLERLLPEGVALRSLEPSEKGTVLKLSASARNFSAVRKFIENLEGSKVFSEIFLTDQTATKEGAQKGLNFSVTCRVSAS